MTNLVLLTVQLMTNTVIGHWEGGPDPGFTPTTPEQIAYYETTAPRWVPASTNYWTNFVHGYSTNQQITTGQFAYVFPSFSYFTNRDVDGIQGLSFLTNSSVASALGLTYFTNKDVVSFLAMASFTNSAASNTLLFSYFTNRDSAGVAGLQYFTNRDGVVVTALVSSSNRLTSVESQTNATGGRLSSLEGMTNAFATTSGFVGTNQLATNLLATRQLITNFNQLAAIQITTNTQPSLTTNANGSLTWNIPQVSITYSTNTWALGVLQTNTSGKLQFEKLQYDVATLLGGAGRVQVFVEINGAFVRADNGGQAALLGLVAGTYNSAAVFTIPGQRWFPSNVVSGATITPLNRVTATFGP